MKKSREMIKKDKKERIRIPQRKEKKDDKER